MVIFGLITALMILVVVIFVRSYYFIKKNGTQLSEEDAVRSIDIFANKPRSFNTMFITSYRLEKVISALRELGKITITIECETDTSEYDLLMQVLRKHDLEVGEKIEPDAFSTFAIDLYREMKNQNEFAFIGDSHDTSVPIPED